MAAIEIALLQQYQWKIELFFRWVKQHLKSKSFWGASPNAFKIYIYSGIIAYCFVAIIAYELKVDRFTLEF